jgi:glycosyltransferase involved in cell wall biosynthesis
MKIVFVSSGLYPDGGAASNRHLAYAKGLYELGHDVEFILLIKQKWLDEQIIIDGVKYTQCVSGNSGLNIPKLKTLWAYIKSIKKAKKKIKYILKQNPRVSMILLDTRTISLIPLIRYGKKHSIKILHERTEYPFVVSSKNLFGRINLFIYLKNVIKQFDGIYVINKALVKYFYDVTNGQVPLKIINMIVDPSRFDCPQQIQSSKEKVITFCGGLDGEKDGVPILIDSFAILSKNFPSAQLQLIGSLNIQDKVILTGTIDRNEVPKYLCNSFALALARPSNKQAEGGFPTKLGEYLATGNPVVVTRVGEIGDFLTDQKNAFVSEPDSAELFAEKLGEAFTNENSISIGLEGKKLVYHDFHYLSQARELEKFIFEVVGNA